MAFFTKNKAIFLKTFQNVLPSLHFCMFFLHYWQKNYNWHITDIRLKGLTVPIYQCDDICLFFIYKPNFWNIFSCSAIKMVIPLLLAGGSDWVCLYSFICLSADTRVNEVEELTVPFSLLSVFLLIFSLLKLPFRFRKKTGSFFNF